MGDPGSLLLELADYQGVQHWDWRLKDAAGEDAEPLLWTLREHLLEIAPGEEARADEMIAALRAAIEQILSGALEDETAATE